MVLGGGRGKFLPKGKNSADFFILKKKEGGERKIIERGKRHKGILSRVGSDPL